MGTRAIIARTSCGILLGFVLGVVLSFVLIPDYSYKKTGIDLDAQFAFRFSCSLMITFVTVMCGVIAYFLGRHGKYALLGGVIGATIAGIGIRVISDAPAYQLASHEILTVLFQNAFFWLAMAAGACWGSIWSMNRSPLS